ncbi:IS110 family transposase [Phyllobacterium sp. A18/5-2]|uniref:IS110 family transposase n=1 Tax=Phyllobacterium sp. A18/5-2 TaxID=2978392 RepID=UPI0021CA7060|nr:IS110 family transposase [Phyllobacterium sp. A18/5-2]UXN64428.1 IS110 family transposase [Phyllobacterium sp. A18/5-2]
MKAVTAIGLDLAKQVFHVHGSDAEGSPTFSRKLRRVQVKEFFENIPPCTVGMEACGSAYYWAREIASFGHDVRIMPAIYVKPFVKRGKTDAIDAEAICDAVLHKQMRFIPVKSAEQQAFSMLLKVRALFLRQRTKATNALRSHMAEFGLVVPAGTTKVTALFSLLKDDGNGQMPQVARLALCEIMEEIEHLDVRIDQLDAQIASQAKQDEDFQRLMTIPGVGKTTAAAIKAYVGDAGVFKSSRHFASWIGLTPKVHASGGKTRLGSISKAGNSVLRSLLYMGARAILRQSRKSENSSSWLTKLMIRRPFKVVAIAVANKMARTIWALLKNGGTYHPPIEPNVAST